MIPAIDASSCHVGKESPSQHGIRNFVPPGKAQRRRSAKTGWRRYLATVVIRLLLICAGSERRLPVSPGGPRERSIANSTYTDSLSTQIVVTMFVRDNFAALEAIQPFDEIGMFNSLATG
jgi:hypothetical protein